MGKSSTQITSKESKRERRPNVRIDQMPEHSIVSISALSQYSPSFLDPPRSYGLLFFFVLYEDSPENDSPRSQKAEYCWFKENSERVGWTQGWSSVVVEITI